MDPGGGNPGYVGPAVAAMADPVGKAVAAIPIDMPELVRPIGIIHRLQKLLTPIAERLIEFLQSVER